MTTSTKYTTLAVFTALFLLFTALCLYAQPLTSENEKQLAQTLLRLPLQNMGLDDQPELTNEEAQFFNARFDQLRNSFDFTGKRILFAKGSGARMLVSKSNYFRQVLDPLMSKGFISPEALWVIPDFKQKEAGYDALITLWVQRNPRFEDCVGFIDFATLQGDPRTANLNGFPHFDKLGLNRNPLVNDYEADFLNRKLYKQRGGFDFTGKRVAFVVGNTADTLSSKPDYFEENISYLTLNKLGTLDELLVLTPHEQALSNGYDAVVLSWRYYNFPLSPNARRKLMLNLSRVH